MLGRWQDMANLGGKSYLLDFEKLGVSIPFVSSSHRSLLSLHMYNVCMTRR